MIKVGFVYEIKDGIATVNIPRFSGCGGNCKSCEGSCESTIHQIEVINTINANRGDFVEIEYSEKASLKISMLVYILPLFTFFVGLFIGRYFINMSEERSLLAGLIGLVIGFLALYLLDKKYRRRDIFASIVKKADISDIEKYYQ